MWWCILMVIKFHSIYIFHFHTFIKLDCVCADVHRNDFLTIIQYYSSFLYKMKKKLMFTISQTIFAGIRDWFVNFNFFVTSLSTGMESNWIVCWPTWRTGPSPVAVKWTTWKMWFLLIQYNSMLYILFSDGDLLNSTLLI